jgi:hypothetical protein
MRHAAALVALMAVATGCRSGMVRPAPVDVTHTTSQRSGYVSRAPRANADPMPPVPDDPGGPLAAVADEDPIAPDPDTYQSAPPPRTEIALAAYQPEEIASPEPAPSESGAADPDQLVKPISAVPLDIRPTQGEMPFDAAAQAFAAVNAKQPWDTRARRPVIVGYTPWTICFRPLYFEEIGLERYGCSAGVFQPFISYSHFLTTVPLMPYRMVVRCPRSCVCSNGASQCGDPLLPGYTTSGVKPLAAVFEAGIIAGIVIALP